MENRSIFKDKKVLSLLAVMLVLVVLAYLIGNKTATTKINNEKVSYKEVAAKVDDKKRDLKKVKKDAEKAEIEYEKIENQVSDKQEAYDQVISAIAQKDSLSKEISDLKNELKTIQDSLKDKKTELSQLTGQVKEAAGKPRVLSAGKFIVGKDIPPHRYKAVPNGGFGNFFVNEGMDVNIILGGDFGESEYVFMANEGDVIELTTSAKFIPIE